MWRKGFFFLPAPIAVGRYSSRLRGVRSDIPATARCRCNLGNYLARALRDGNMTIQSPAYWCGMQQADFAPEVDWIGVLAGRSTGPFQFRLLLLAVMEIRGWQAGLGVTLGVIPKSHSDKGLFISLIFDNFDSLHPPFCCPAITAQAPPLHGCL